METNQVAKIASSALIVNLSISLWTGRKLDKSVSQEIDSSKNTKGRAGNYYKNLFAGSGSLERITKIAGEIRTWHYLMTQPWGDNGDRLISVSAMPEYKAQLDDFEERFVEVVNEFLTEYSSLVSAAAFTLGDLFDRNNYPTVEEIEGKFGFRYSFSPVPTAGDFRVDIGEEGLKQLRSHYENSLAAKLDTAMKDAWNRVYTVLGNISERLEDNDKGGHKIFRDSLIDNALEVCTLLQHFNFTGDTGLNSLRLQLEGTLRGIDSDAIRNDDALRRSIKKEVDVMVDKFCVG